MKISSASITRPVLRPLGLLVTAALASLQANAAEEDLYFASLPVVASVSRLPQPLSEAPGAVTVIDRDMIRATGARNFADLLRLVPGFQVTPPNQDGAVVAYHGLSNEEYTPRVQVLIDGRSLYSPLFRSGVNWNLLPVALDDVERIEVSRGSNSAAYGSSAFLGVINIITTDPSQAKGWMVSANYGNQSVRDETLRWGGKVGTADVRLTFQQLGDGGFSKMFDGSLGWFDPHDSRHAHLVDLRADMPLTERDELRISLNQAYDVSQFGRPNSISDPFRDLSQSSTSLSTEWRRSLDSGGETKLRYSHVDDWSSGRYQAGVSFTGVDSSSIAFMSQINVGGKSSIDELEFQHIFSPSTQTRAVWGTNVSHAAVSSQEQFYTSDRHQRSDYRLFGNLEYRPDPKWLVNVGSSAEYDSISGTMFDPRVNVSYHVTPENTVRLIASRAHRAPSLYEAQGDARVTPIGATSPVDRTYLAAPGLKAERIDTLEAGYLGEFKRVGASVDVRIFREYIPNRINIVPYPLPPSSPDDGDRLQDRFSQVVANQFPYGRANAALNMEQVTIRGYEYQWRWQPLEATRLMYSHAYIMVDEDLNTAVISDDPSNVARIARQTLDSAPRHSSSAMLMQRLPQNFDLSVMYFKSGFMRWRRNSFTEPSERVDYRLAKSFRWGSTRAELAFTSQLANHDQDGRRETRIATETHWVTLRLEY